MPTLDQALLIGAVVTLAAIAAARMGSRLGLPALLLFLFLGMALGEADGFNFDSAQLAHDLGFAALVLILAEGGLTTKWSDIRPALKPSLLLATLGTAVSMGLVGAFTHYVLGLPLMVALLFGAVTAPTDSAAVFSVLRTVPLPSRVRAVLEAESGLNDAPTVLVVAALTLIAGGQQPQGGTVGLLGMIAFELIGGVVLGLVVGWVGSQVMKKLPLPSSGLYAIAALTWPVLAYGAGVALHISGFAATYVAAVLLGNAKLPHRQSTHSFVEGIGWIAQIGLFVMLGLLADINRLSLNDVLIGVAAGLFLVIVARPLSVISSVAWFKVPWREQAFISWAGLRGAVPIILATVPLAAGVSQSGRLFDIVVVFVIVFTALEAPTLPWVARKLGLVDPHGSTDVDIEAAPLERLKADLLQVRVPSGSKLAGVSVRELRLPPNSVVSLIIRDETPFAPSGRDRLEVGDELMIITPTLHRVQVETRLTEIGRGGRLARWHGVRAD